MTETTENTRTQAEIDAEIAGANADAAVSAAAQPDAGLTPAQKAAATKAANKLAAAAAGAAPDANEAKAAVNTPAKPKRVKIILDENDAIPPGGQFFGVNGTGYQIQPGKEVEIPEFLLGVIDNAVTTKPVVNEDGQVVGYRDVPRFPYRIVK